MKRIYTLLHRGIILGLLFIFGCYNYVFIRQKTLYHIIDTINPISYNTYFDIKQIQPNTFFTIPAFREYTKWCHENKKLCSLIPMQQLYADMQWLGSIQFVGSQANPNELLGLSKLLDNLSNLAPYRNYPYVFGQLLVPISKMVAARSDDESLAMNSWNDAKKLADKGEFYTCDPQKISAINAMDEKNFINTVYDSGAKETYRNPCPTYERAHYAAFNAFYYKRDAEESARNYKISSFSDNSPGLAPVMAALVYGRGGEHLKSATLWYDRYLNLQSQIGDGNNEVAVKNAERSLKKAVFEVQLQLITDADNDSQKICKKSYTCLQKKGYIKTAITKSYNDICEGGKNTQNLRCTLLYIGLLNKWITLHGEMKYVVDPGLDFGWSEQYNSWWVLAIQ